MRFDAQPPRSLSEYREFRAPPLLANRFLCFWTQTVVGSRGACIDIVLIRDEPPMVVGPWDAPFVVRLAVGTSITGARLHPGCASCLLGIPASELLNQAIPIAALKGAMQSMRLEEVIDQPSAAAADQLSPKFSPRRLKISLPWTRPPLPASWLSRHPHERIGQLSRWIGISERQLHRRFSAAIGYGPKMFQSVLRFQRLLKTARVRGTEESLADLAAGAGYADQAHMTRDVHRLANLRPTVLLRSAESNAAKCPICSRLNRSLRTIVLDMTRRELIQREGEVRKTWDSGSLFRSQ